jgi:hypothetical protein
MDASCLLAASLRSVAVVYSAAYWSVQSRHTTTLSLPRTTISLARARILAAVQGKSHWNG